MVSAWVAPLLGEAVAESRHRKRGSEAVLERVSEMVFVDAARRHLESLPEGGGSGGLAGLCDRHVGLPPMQYLATWRMQLGANLLRDSKATVATVAQEIAHESQAAFARAFRRLGGQPPTAWWRTQRSAP